VGRRTKEMGGGMSDRVWSPGVVEGGKSRLLRV
jgi:hypothetical protein